jgi:hypothetical protein
MNDLAERAKAALNWGIGLDTKAIIRDQMDEIARLEDGPNGLANLRAILADQPFGNSALSVHEIETILANKGGFMPDEAVMWFREWRAQPKVTHQT